MRFSDQLEKSAFVQAAVSDLYSNFLSTMNERLLIDMTCPLPNRKAVVCISGEPGAGKTSFISHIVGMALDTYSECINIYVPGSRNEALTLHEFQRIEPNLHEILTSPGNQACISLVRIWSYATYSAMGYGINRAAHEPSEALDGNRRSSEARDDLFVTARDPAFLRHASAPAASAASAEPRPSGQPWPSPPKHPFPVYSRSCPFIIVEVPHFLSAKIQTLSRTTLNVSTRVDADSAPASGGRQKQARSDAFFSTSLKSRADPAGAKAPGSLRTAEAACFSRIVHALHRQADCILYLVAADAPVVSKDIGRHLHRIRENPLTCAKTKLVLSKVDKLGQKQQVVSALASLASSLSYYLSYKDFPIMTLCLPTYTRVARERRAFLEREYRLQRRNLLGSIRRDSEALLSSTKRIVSFSVYNAAPDDGAASRPATKTSDVYGGIGHQLAAEAYAHVAQIRSTTPPVARRSKGDRPLSGNIYLSNEIAPGDRQPPTNDATHRTRSIPLSASKHSQRHSTPSTVINSFNLELNDITPTREDRLIGAQRASSNGPARGGRLAASPAALLNDIFTSQSRLQKNVHILEAWLDRDPESSGTNLRDTGSNARQPLILSAASAISADHSGTFRDNDPLSTDAGDAAAGMYIDMLPELKSFLAEQAVRASEDSVRLLRANMVHIEQAIMRVSEINRRITWQNRCLVFLRIMMVTFAFLMGLAILLNTNAIGAHLFERGCLLNTLSHVGAFRYSDNGESIREKISAKHSITCIVFYDFMYRRFRKVFANKWLYTLGCSLTGAILLLFVVTSTIRPKKDIDDETLAEIKHAYGTILLTQERNIHKSLESTGDGSAEQ